MVYVLHIKLKILWLKNFMLKNSPQYKNSIFVHTESREEGCALHNPHATYVTNIGVITEYVTTLTNQKENNEHEGRDKA